MDRKEIERTIEELGFEVVTFSRGGGSRRPLLRIRIDRPDSEPGRSSVSVEDCAIVTRALRGRLDDEGAADWAIEVSSPGVDRPLTKPRDFARFSGQRIRVKGYAPLAGRTKELEGTLLGLLEDDAEVFALEVDSERVELALSDIAGARLVYVWDGTGRED